MFDWIRDIGIRPIPLWVLLIAGLFLGLMFAALIRAARKPI